MATLTHAIAAAQPTMIPVSAITDLFYMLFWMGMIVMVFYLIAILHKVYQAMRDFRAIVATNRKNIDLTLNEVPLITKNIQELTTEVSHASQQFRPTIENVAETSANVTDTIKNNNPINETIISAYKTMNNIHKLVESFSKKNGYPMEVPKQTKDV